MLSNEEYLNDLIFD
jgi:hypothetical protein